jgi:hypothetical protein
MRSVFPSSSRQANSFGFVFPLQQNMENMKSGYALQGGKRPESPSGLKIHENNRMNFTKNSRFFFELGLSIGQRFTK